MLRLRTGEGPQRQSRCCHQRSGRYWIENTETGANKRNQRSSSRSWQSELVTEAQMLIKPFRGVWREGEESSTEKEFHILGLSRRGDWKGEEEPWDWGEDDEERLTHRSQCEELLWPVDGVQGCQESSPSSTKKCWIDWMKHGPYHPWQKRLWWSDGAESRLCNKLREGPVGGKGMQSKCENFFKKFRCE